MAPIGLPGCRGEVPPGPVSPSARMRYSAPGRKTQLPETDGAYL